MNRNAESKTSWSFMKKMSQISQSWKWAKMKSDKVIIGKERRFPLLELNVC